MQTFFYLNNNTTYLSLIVRSFSLCSRDRLQRRYSQRTSNQADHAAHLLVTTNSKRLDYTLPALTKE